MASNTTLDGRALERLENESIAWLTTIRSDGQPQSSPIWFFWHDGALYIRSEPGAGKVANIRHQPRVSIHLDSDGFGGDILTVEGEAELLETVPKSVDDAYFAKYERQIREGLQTTPEQLVEDFGTGIRIAPARVRSW